MLNKLRAISQRIVETWNSLPAEIVSDSKALKISISNIYKTELLNRSLEMGIFCFTELHCMQVRNIEVWRLQTSNGLLVLIIPKQEICICVSTWRNFKDAIYFSNPMFVASFTHHFIIQM